MRLTGHVTRMGERKDASRLLVSKPERKYLLGRPRSRCENNIEMDLKEISCGDVD